MVDLGFVDSQPCLALGKAVTPLGLTLDLSEGTCHTLWAHTFVLPASLLTAELGGHTRGRAHHPPGSPGCLTCPISMAGFRLEPTSMTMSVRRFCSGGSGGEHAV